MEQAAGTCAAAAAGKGSLKLQNGTIDCKWRQCQLHIYSIGIRNNDSHISLAYGSACNRPHPER